MSMYSYFMFMYLHRASWHSSTTLTEGFPCFFLSCKANVRVKLAKKGHGPHSSSQNFCVVLYIVCVVLCIVCVVLCIVCVVLCIFCVVLCIVCVDCVGLCIVCV